MKEKLLRFKDIIISNSKLLFPVAVVALVATTVVVTLSIKNKKDPEPEIVEAAPLVVSDSDLEVETVVPDIPAPDEVKTLIYTYYDALGNGDADRIANITNVADEMQKIKIQELGKYIDYYTNVDIYAKPGPEEKSYVVYAYTKAKFVGFDAEASGSQTFYVCTDEDGNLYLNEGVISQEVFDYIYEMNFQDDVLELYNKTTAEYNETMVANPELFEFIAAMESEIRTATGLMIAAQETGAAVQEQSEENTQEGETQTEADAGVTVPEVGGPKFATASATVNVRSSDSETADKIGKVATGSKIEVLEQKANGWSKVKFEKKEGYIKSEYLQLAESASGVKTIGTVTATTNINIRSKASEAGEKLGVLAGGESLSLVSDEDGWCKVIYNGQIGYVKADYVQR